MRSLQWLVLLFGLFLNIQIANAGDDKCLSLDKATLNVYDPVFGQGMLIKIFRRYVYLPNDYWIDILNSQKEFFVKFKSWDADRKSLAVAYCGLLSVDRPDLSKAKIENVLNCQDVKVKQGFFAVPEKNVEFIYIEDEEKYFLIMDSRKGLLDFVLKSYLIKN